MSGQEEGPVSLSEAPTKRLNMIEAINEALHIMMERDPDVVVFGEDVGYFGGVFRATAGLQKKFGKTRVFDTPINECGIIGAAVGMGAYGLRPVPEIQFADYIYPGLDQLISEAARLRYRSAGEFIVRRTSTTVGTFSAVVLDAQCVQDDPGGSVRRDRLASGGEVIVGGRVHLPQSRAKRLHVSGGEHLAQSVLADELRLGPLRVSDCSPRR